MFVTLLICGSRNRDADGRCIGSGLEIIEKWPYKSGEHAS